jgi:hypothetical protein
LENNSLDISTTKSRRALLLKNIIDLLFTGNPLLMEQCPEKQE